MEMQWPYEGYRVRDSRGAWRCSEPPPRHFRIRGAEYVKALRPLAPKAQRIVNKMRLEEAEDLVLMCYMSQDFREGVSAFLEKRPAQWTGR